MDLKETYLMQKFGLGDENMDQKIEEYKFIVPSIQDEDYSTAYLLGNINWLLMHSKSHCEMPLLMMPTQIFPAITNKQFVLALSEKGSPVFYMAWANFTAEDEANYIKNTNTALTIDNWNKGDRPWILFFVAPFGHSQIMSTWVKNHLFLDSPEVRFLYHSGQERGARIILKRGKNVKSEVGANWREAHPISSELPIQFPRS